MGESQTFEDAWKEAVPSAVPQAKPLTIPQTGQGTTTYENALKEKFSGPRTEYKPPPAKDLGFDEMQRQNAVDRENHYLAGAQGIVPQFEAHGEPLGKAVWDENDPHNMYYKNPKGEMQKTGDNHVMLRDPGDNEYKIFERKPETSYGPVAGAIMARAVPFAEGFATAAPASGASGAVTNLAKTTGVDMGQKPLFSPSNWGRGPTGVPVAVASDNPMAQQAGQTLSKFPIAGAPLKEAASGMGAQLEQAAQAAERLPTGTRVTSEEAGSTVDKALGTYLDTNPTTGTLSGKTKTLYDKVDTLVNPAITTDSPGAGSMRNTMNTVTRIGQKYDAADWDKYQSALKEVLGPLTKPGGINYDTLKFVIRNVGEMIGRPDGLPAGVHLSELKQIYGSLKDDMRGLLAAADKSGTGDAVKAWDQAGRYTAAASLRREKLLNMLGEKSDEGIFGKILSLAGTTNSADAKLLQTVKRSLPTDAWEEIQGAVTGRLGWINGKEGATFDPGKFVKDYNGLSDKGKDVVFGATTDSKIRVALDSISQISERWGEARKMGGGGIGHAVGEWAGPIAIWELSRELLHSGEWKAPFYALGAALTGRGVAAALARPATAEAVSTWGKSVEAVRDQLDGRRLAAFNNATRALALEVEKNFQIPADQIEPRLRGAVPQQLQDKINGQ